MKVFSLWRPPDSPNGVRRKTVRADHRSTARYKPKVRIERCWFLHSFRGDTNRRKLRIPCFDCDKATACESHGRLSILSKTSGHDLIAAANLSNRGHGRSGPYTNLRFRRSQGKQHRHITDIVIRLFGFRDCSGHRRESRQKLRF